MIKCLRNKLKEDKSEIQVEEMIDTTSKINEMNLTKKIRYLDRSKDKKPKFKVGKIVSKYLIINILSFCYNQEEILEIMYAISQSLRLMLIENFKAIIKLTI